MDNTDKMPDMLTVKEFQIKTRLSRTGAYNIINSGEIPIVKIGGRKLVLKEDFFNWLNNQRIEKDGER